MAVRYRNDGDRRRRVRRRRDQWWLHDQNPAQGFSTWRGDASDPDWHELVYRMSRRFGGGPPDHPSRRRDYNPDYERDYDRDYGPDFGGPYGYSHGRRASDARPPGFDREYGRSYWRDYSRDPGGYSARDWRSSGDPIYDRGPEQYERGELFSRDWDYGGYGVRGVGYSAAARYHRPRYAGVGPRGYRRSDERIQEDVNELLTADPNIDASDIEVRVEAGVVTLTGVVEDRASKRLAEDLARKREQ